MKLPATYGHATYGEEFRLSNTITNEKILSFLHPKGLVPFSSL